jgi:ribosomal protein S18 acetylase RimI-like enzyme
MMKVSIRPLQEKDKDAIRIILRDTQMFHDDEIDVAMSVIDEYLDGNEESGYWSYVAVNPADRVIGFTIVGPNPITIGTYDLYWIAVDQSQQGKGVGRELLLYAEKLVTKQKGRLIIAETSSRPIYLRTRSFYKQQGYSELAQICDYYNVGDDLIIFGKYLKEV